MPLCQGCSWHWGHSSDQTAQDPHLWGGGRRQQLEKDKSYRVIAENDLEKQDEQSRVEEMGVRGGGWASGSTREAWPRHQAEREACGVSVGQQGTLGWREGRTGSTGPWRTQQGHSSEHSRKPREDLEQGMT